MEQYHFVTQWFFNAPIDQVWEEIKDARIWSTWLQDFRKVTPRSTKATPEAGAATDIEYKGTLPYTFRFTLEITALQPPHLMELKSTGDLVGTGKWVLEPQGNGTAVTYYWDVGTTNSLFNLVAKFPFMRRLSEKNHELTMARAFAALKERVE